MSPQNVKPELILPPPGYVALALVTIRSKPAHYNIDDYLAMLSKSTSPQSGSASGVDAARFWKEAYQRAEREKSELQDYVNRFEKERFDQSDTLTTNSKKRKAAEVPVKANTQSKRQKAGRDSPAEPTMYLHVPDSNSRAATAVSRHLFQLQCLLRSNDPPLDQLCLRVGALCETLEQMITTSRKENTRILKSDRDTNHSDLLNLPDLLKIAFPLILKAVEHATSREAVDDDLTIANGSLVQLFQSTLGRLHQVVLDEVTRQEEEARAARKRSKANMTVKTTSFEQRKREHQDIGKALTQILVIMLVSTDAAKDSHCELVEGLLCALLDHIGSSLSLLVFANLDVPKTDTEIAPPAGLNHVSHVNTKAALAAAIVEGPYLVTILKKGLCFLRDNQQHMSATIKEIFSWTDSPEKMSSDMLRSKIEDRLQGTLLRGIFGDDDKTFENALRREHPLDQTDLDAIRNNLRDVEMDQSTSFIGQIWEQLGWEVLSRGPKGEPIFT